MPSTDEVEEIYAARKSNASVQNSQVAASDALIRQSIQPAQASSPESRQWVAVRWSRGLRGERRRCAIEETKRTEKPEKGDAQELGRI